MSKETKNPLIESFLRIHEKMIGYGGKDDPYQGKSQQKFTSDKTTPDALRVKPSAPSVQAAPKKAEPTPAPKPKAEAPIPTPKPEQPDKTITPTGNPNMLGIGAKPYDPLSSVKAPEPKPILPSMSGGSGDYRKPYNPLSSISTPKVSKSPAIGSANAGIGSKDIDTYDTNTQRDRDYTGDTDSFATTRSIKLPSTDSKQRGPMPISGERGSAMSHNFSTDLVDMLADKSTKMQYNTDAITGKNQTFMQRLTNRKVGKKSSVSPELEKTLKSIIIGETESMTNKLIDSFLKLQATNSPNLFEAAKKAKKLDPVGKEDEDIDNDGIPIKKDKHDQYLANRRKAIGKAMKEATDPKAENDGGVYITPPRPMTDEEKPKKKLPSEVVKTGPQSSTAYKQKEVAEEVEYIDEVAVPDSHKQAMKNTYGAGVVKIDNKNRTISHTNKRFGETNTHAYNPNNKQPIGRHLSTITVQEDVEFSEAEQIDEALSAEHKTAIKAHVKGMWGKGEVAFGSQGGKDFVSHSDGIQKHVHSIHYKKGVPHVTHFLSMDEEVKFSEAELAHFSAILEANPVAPVPDDYSGAAGGVSKRDLSDETVAEEEVKRGRGRPKGRKSGSMHGSGTGEGGETKNLAAQIRFSRPSDGNFMLKHPKTGVTKAVPAKAATEFYSKYSGAEKPAEKEAHHDAFLTKHFGGESKPKTGITLPKMPASKS